MAHHSLADRRVVITGGSAGIGAAAAALFEERGARVVVAARTQPATPYAGTFISADVSTAAGVEQLASRAVEVLGGVDVLINNAGSQSHVPDGVLAMGDDIWLRDLNLNLMAAVRLDRALLPAMMAQRNGVILHVTSGQARLPGPGALPYAAAKAALTTYSKGLANEVGPQGIRVNVVVPGLIVTAASERRLAERAEASGTDYGAELERTVDALGIPLRRAGRAGEVAELLAFLASESGSYITGSQYVVDGGALPTV